jgi:hypothetical protein
LKTASNLASKVAFPIFQPTVCGASQILISTPLWLWRKTLLWSPRIPNTRRRPFLSAATRALRDRLEKPVEQFQAYFMALFSDKDYSKVLDSIAKVDKALRATAPSASNSASSATRSSFKNTRLFCNFCGIPGHTSPFCFLSVGVQLGAGSFLTSEPPVLGTILTPSDL